MSYPPDVDALRDELAAAKFRIGELSAALSQIKDAQIPPGRIRWCTWPRCWRSFDAAPGPTVLGWQRLLQDQVLLCADHSVTGHEPDVTLVPETGLLTATCSCRQSKDLPNGTFADAIAWWSQHVTDLYPAEDLPALSPAEQYVAAVDALMGEVTPLLLDRVRIADAIGRGPVCVQGRGAKCSDPETCPRHRHPVLSDTVLLELLDVARQAVQWSPIRADLLYSPAGERRDGTTPMDQMYLNILVALVEHFYERPGHQM